MSLTEFFYMGGYGFYVWASYGLAFVLLLAILLASIRQRRRLLADFVRRAKRTRRDT